MNKTEKQIIPMVCPVCGKFYFDKLNDEDLEDGETPNSVQCHKCGWFYDLEQTNNPDLKFQSNELSLNEFKVKYFKLLKDNPKYDYLEANKPPKSPHQCPVCGEYTFKDLDSYDICPICGWEDDGWFEGGGANEMSLEEAIENFKNNRQKNPQYRWYEKK